MFETQSDVPYLEALLNYAESTCLPFHMPGHMKGQGAPADLLDLMGAKALRADTAQVLGLANPSLSFGGLQAAQQLAADLYGAAHTWFLLNGSTCGNMAMLMACCPEGEEVIVPRNAHRSVYAGLIMSGARPVYAALPYDQALGTCHALTVNELRRLLEKHPGVRACLFTSVTNYGAGADAHALIPLLHRQGIPALVDEAWGPHLPFLSQARSPLAEQYPPLPASALEAGADLLVQSAHKLLTALSQASFLHWGRSSLVDRAAVDAVLALLQSTSPNSLLLASLDCARRQAACSGVADWERTLALADSVREAVSQIPGLRVMRPQGAFSWDRTRLLVSALELCLDGGELEWILRYEENVQVEMSDMTSVMIILTPAHSQAQGRAVVQALQNVSRHYARHKGPKVQLAIPPVYADFPRVELTPRQAFYRHKVERVPLDQAAGRICAERVTPYPPGIPFICPGEVPEKEHIEYLRELQALKVPLAGLSDATAQTLLVYK